LLTIRRSANLVRKACERFSVSDEAGLFDFYSRHDLAGMCAIASFALKQYLKDKHEIETDLVHGHYVDFSGHCWLTWRDNYLIDITATQFNYIPTLHSYPRVYIDNIDKNINYMPNHGIKNNYNDFFLWPTGQRPNAGVVERVLEIADSLPRGYLKIMTVGRS
jgi:hypothetical protein